MKILVTGAKGFVGKNLCANLKNIRDGKYCYAPVTHKATLGEIVELLKQFAAQPQTLMIPDIPAGSFAKKLYSTYLSYIQGEGCLPLEDEH